MLSMLSYSVTVWDHRLTDEKLALFEKEMKMLSRVLGCGRHSAGTVSYTTDLSELPSAVTYEVLAENLVIKRSVISRLPYAAGTEGLLTNTSSYSPSEIDPDAVGLHFFNPICYLKFAELSMSYTILRPSVKSVVESMIDRGVEVIEVSENRGYIGNYLLFQEIANALKLIDKYGYGTVTVDRILSHMGRSVSIFDIIDLVGVDITKTIIMNLKEKDESIYCSPLLDKATGCNILGKKNRTSIRSIIDS